MHTLMYTQGTPMCGIVFAIVIFRVGLRQRTDSDSAFASGSASGTGHRMTMNRFTRTSFMPPAASAETALQVFVHSETGREQDPWDSFKGLGKAEAGAAGARGGSLA